MRAPPKVSRMLPASPTAWSGLVNKSKSKPTNNLAVSSISWATSSSASGEEAIIVGGEGGDGAVLADLESTLEVFPFPFLSKLALPDLLPLFVGLELGSTLVEGTNDGANEGLPLSLGTSEGTTLGSTLMDGTNDGADVLATVLPVVVAEDEVELPVVVWTVDKVDDVVLAPVEDGLTPVLPVVADEEVELPVVVVLWMVDKVEDVVLAPVEDGLTPVLPVVADEEVELPVPVVVVLWTVHNVEDVVLAPVVDEAVAKVVLCFDKVIKIK